MRTDEYLKSDLVDNPNPTVKFIERLCNIQILPLKKQLVV
jgi:hypothetical protein